VTDPAPRPAQDPERHGRRAVWIAFLITMVGTAAVYKAKAEDDRSAIIRWHHQVLELRAGTNIWNKYYFPNPPIFPISLYPLTTLPAVDAAMVWFTLKATLAAACLLACMKMAIPKGVKFPWWAQGAVVLLALRPIMGDLFHANNNLIILSLIVAMLAAWRRGYDVVAGLCLALAITYKVTPALFLPYFLYKRSWKTLAATAAGIFLFVVVIPSLVLGPAFNAQCLTAWYRRILGPYVEDGVGSPQEVNQSMIGVFTRILTASGKAIEHGYRGVHYQGNLLSLPHSAVTIGLKVASLGLVGLLAFFCRTKAARRDDPRLLGEFSLVVLTMLFASERSWKHHFVTLVLPIAYLVAHVAVTPGSKPRRWIISFGLLLSAFLMACTSKDFGSIFGKDGHVVAQFYGLFFLAGVVIYGLTAWCVWQERSTPIALEQQVARSAVPTPHVGAVSRSTV
jgi:alpha-1,2-mannosyltransferase